MIGAVGRDDSWLALRLPIPIGLTGNQEPRRDTSRAAVAACADAGETRMHNERSSTIYSRIGALALALTASVYGCRQAQPFEDILVRVVHVDQREISEPQPPGNVAVGAQSDERFVNIGLQIEWSETQHQLSWKRSDLEMEDVAGNRYEASMFPTQLMAAGAKTTLQQIGFSLPRSAQPRRFCVRNACFNL